MRRAVHTAARPPHARASPRRAVLRGRRSEPPAPPRRSARGTPPGSIARLRRERARRAASERPAVLRLVFHANDAPAVGRGDHVRSCGGALFPRARMPRSAPSIRRPGAEGTPVRPPLSRVLSGSSIAASRRSVSLSPVRHCTASAPWPGAGSIASAGIHSVTWVASPRRVTPAAASNAASYSPSSTLRTLVSTFPRIGLTKRSGRRASNWPWRRRLLVPTTAPRGSVASVQALRATRQSRGSVRLVTAPIVNSRPVSTGRSFNEWTARSISSAASACSSRVVNTPLPPISGSAVPRRRRLR